MGVTPRETVLRFLTLVEEGDLSGKHAQVGELFADDAVYHVQVPAKERVRGRQAIVDELLKQTAHYSALKVEFVSVVADGGSVVVERIDHLTLKPGVPSVANELVAVFEVDEAGLITGWREYWDASVLGQRMQTAVQAADATGEEQR